MTTCCALGTAHASDHYPAGCAAFAGSCSAYALDVMLVHRLCLTQLAVARCDGLSHCALQGQHRRSVEFPAASSSRVPASHRSGSGGTLRGSPAIEPQNASCHASSGGCGCACTSRQVPV